VTILPDLDLGAGVAVADVAVELSQAGHSEHNREDRSPGNPQR
jgi:hypothetical protein